MLYLLLIYSFYWLIKMADRQVSGHWRGRGGCHCLFTPRTGLKVYRFFSFSPFFSLLHNLRTCSGPWGSYCFYQSNSRKWAFFFKRSDWLWAIKELSYHLAWCSCTIARFSGTRVRKISIGEALSFMLLWRMGSIASFWMHEHAHASLWFRLFPHALCH